MPPRPIKPCGRRRNSQEYINANKKFRVGDIYWFMAEGESLLFEIEEKELEELSEIAKRNMVNAILILQIE